MEIIVETINNSFLHIDAEASIMHELSDYFSFTVPNCHFMKKYKSGLWDGKIRLYKIAGSTLPAGLFGILCKFASDNDYALIDSRTPSLYKKPTESELSTFLADLNLHTKQEKIDFHDHQVQAIKESISNERLTILSPTASGKSAIIYALLRWYQEIVENKILIIVPTVNLVEQMYTDFQDYASEVEWTSENNCHKIYQGQKKYSDKQVFISTWQSLQRMSKDYFQQFDCIICDEVHLAEAKKITKIMENSTNATIKLGFTGTLKSKTLHQLSIVALFGDIRKVSSSKELMKKDLMTNLQVKFLVLKYNQDISKEICRKKIEEITPNGKKIYRNNYANEMDFIALCRNRNVFISNLVSVLKGNVLVLFTKIEKHGKPLNKLLQQRLNKPVYYISGETKVGKRESIRATMEKEINVVLTASYGTLSTGVNIKNLKFVIFASPYKSEIKVLQSVGRILRKNEGKKQAVLFDLVDNFKYKKYVNYSFKHFQERFDIYKSEKFPVSFSEYNLL